MHSIIQCVRNSLSGQRLCAWNAFFQLGTPPSSRFTLADVDVIYMIKWTTSSLHFHPSDYLSQSFIFHLSVWVSLFILHSKKHLYQYIELHTVLNIQKLVSYHSDAALLFPLVLLWTSGEFPYHFMFICLFTCSCSPSQYPHQGLLDTNFHN